MSKILELREKRAKAWDAAKQFLDAKRGADGMLSEEDTATYDKMEQDVMNLGKEIERLERQAAIDAELSKATSTPLTGKPGAKMGKDEFVSMESLYKICVALDCGIDEIMEFTNNEHA